jgi:hypothetical protein
VPEGRQVFPNLTVFENLVATAANRHGVSEPWTAERIFEMFPELAARRSSMGNLLSGGEQQMLAIGRALMTNPRLLLLDEATEGLAPLIRQKIWAALARIRATASRSWWWTRTSPTSSASPTGMSSSRRAGWSGRAPRPNSPPRRISSTAISGCDRLRGCHGQDGQSYGTTPRSTVSREAAR